MMNLLVTGGAGFIGGNFVNQIIGVQDNLIVVDSLTYASNYGYIAETVDRYDIIFEQVDITNKDKINNIFKKYDITHVVHFAAESHVDRSIVDVYPFYNTNVLGTINMLEAALKYAPKIEKFIHVSTDEVYGSLTPTGKKFNEISRYAPNNPYSASKAASDHFARAFFETYKLPVIITHCSNNYGPNQNKEKLIPKIIENALAYNMIPIYGDGSNIRDWIYVDDHCEALHILLEFGEIGEIYNIGSRNELSNLQIAQLILKILGTSNDLIKFVPDRLGHDFRYAIDPYKIESLLGFYASYNITEGLERTIKWYKENQ